MNRNTVTAIFLLSGMAGLVYEVVWVRLLTLIFGTTTFAVSTVLAAFMAGLALGSYLIGRIVDRLRSPLMAYGLLEIGIGVYAILMPWIFKMLDAVYIQLFDENISNFTAYSLTRFAFSLLVLLVPTTLMGGTLPALSRFFVRTPDSAGRDVGVLYAVNTCGAVVGVLIAGFFLEATFGIRQSIYIAAVVNIAIGVFAIVSARSGVRTTVAHVEGPAQGNWTGREVSPGLMVAVGAISGFCALGYEVLWFRALLPAVLNDTYAFSIMLATFLVGLTLGSFLVSRILDEKRNWMGILSLLQIGTGVVSAITLPIFIGYHNDFFLFLRPRFSTSYQDVALAGFFLSALVMLLPAILMGFSLPIINRLYLSGLNTVGNRIGTLYSINTLASVLGSLVAGFVLIPVIGIVRSVVVFAALNVMAGALVALKATSLSQTRRLAIQFAVPALAFVGLGVIAAYADPTRFHIRMRPDAQTLLYKEGISSTISVVKIMDTRGVYVNGNIVVGASPDALQTVRLLAHLPLLLNPAPKTAAVVGFGMGVTTYSVARYPLDRVDVVELAPEVIEVADLFRDINHSVLDNPNVRLVVEDGRNYLLRSKQKYSVITADPIHPILGSGNLYTQEYYRQCYERLSDDGVMAQYVPIHLLAEKEFRTLIRTFSSVFENSSLWSAYSHLVIVGTKKPFAINFKDLSSRIEKEPSKADLKLSNLESPIALVGRLLLGPSEIHQYTEGAELNTDDRPIIEFRGPWSFGQDTRAGNLASLIPYLAQPNRYVDLSGLSVEEQEVRARSLADVGRARYHVLRGLTSEFRNELPQAIQQYQAALALTPDDPDVRAQLSGVQARNVVPRLR
jgi:spermidine synthase